VEDEERLREILKAQWYHLRKGSRIWDEGNGSKCYHWTGWRSNC
jgi:hypothetical protein